VSGERHIGDFGDRRNGSGGELSESDGERQLSGSDNSLQPAFRIDVPDGVHSGDLHGNGHEREHSDVHVPGMRIQCVSAG
jgi:hypothetical protein